jgi:hypothetical protein
MKLTILYNTKPVYSDFGWTSVANGTIVREHPVLGVLQYLSTSRHVLKEIWGIGLTYWISVIIADSTITLGCLRSAHSNSSNSHYQPEDRYGHKTHHFGDYSLQGCFLRNGLEIHFNSA